MSNVTLNVDQKSIRIHDLLIEDPRAHRLLSLESPDRIEQKVRDALAIGILALDRTAAMSEADWVTQRLEGQIAAVNYALERRSNEVMEAVKAQFDPHKAGSLLGPVTDLVQRTQRELDNRLNETIQSIVESQLRFEGLIDPKRDGTVLKDFLMRFETLTTEVSSSPVLQAKLDELRDEIKSMVTAIKVGADVERMVDEAKDEMISQSPAKGLVFEDQVRDELRRIAEIRNDVVEAVGSQPGKGSSKKGDLVYYVGQKFRIVFELKDYASSRFTFAKIKDLMEDSKANRDAAYGIFLVRDPSCLPDGVGSFFIGDDFCIATHIHLEVATKVAILISHKKMARNGPQGPDWIAIEASIQGIKSLTDELSGIESTCAAAEKSVLKVADGVRWVSRNLTEKVDWLLAELGDHGGDSA